MQRMTQMIAVLMLVAFVLGGCAGYDPTGKQGKVGAVGGAAGGALIGQAIGHDTEATLIGTAVGGLIGYIIGNEMDKSDLQQMNKVYTQPSDVPVSWQNPNTKAQYTMTPTSAYRLPNGQYCRDATITVVIDGKTETVHTTACRDNNGVWRTQS